ncbi:FUSC family protein [Tersicoccus sp. MR15.9]|uniref:FUSC family protein n=1 Tax=Tersicoccus mangrovi TaxID=3121635 RepID=UPI002FE5A789
MHVSEVWSKGRRFIRVRSRVGLARTRKSVLPAVQMTICGVGAYAFAEFVLGHQGPIFAATAGLVSLGFSREPRVRRVLEVGVGCTLGISVGELLILVLGHGLWQAAIILFVSIMLARFLDRGVLFTTQLGLQSLLVVLLPVPSSGPFTRSIDAVVGGAIALLITMIVPRDPRTEPRAELSALLREQAGILRESATAVQDTDATAAWHALVRARGTQSTIDAMRVTLTGSTEIASLAPAYRRHRDELASLGEALSAVDLALRNSRVFVRRLASVLNNAALSESGAESIVAVLRDLADAVDSLAAAVGELRSDGRDRLVRRARYELGDVATRMHPRLLHIEHLEGETLVVLLRPLVVDLLESTGLSHEDARDFLPDLD